MGTLLNDIHYYHTHSLSTSTQATYTSAVNSYRQFCYQGRLVPFPLVSTVLQMYASFLARRVAYKTIKVYLAGIQYHSHMLGHPQLIVTMVQLYYLLRGIRRVQGNLYHLPRRAPITVTDLHILRSHLLRSNLPHHDQLLLCSAVTLAFAGLLRSAEFVSSSATAYHPGCTLLLSDISFTPDRSVLRLHIKSSKTDPFKVGCVVRIGAIGEPLCPVQSLLAFLQIRGCLPGPLFVFRDGRYLTRRYLAVLVQSALPRSHLNTHSFRIGGASAAAAAGISDSAIQLLGRWSSDAYHRYLHLADDTVLNFTRRIFRPHRHDRYWDNVNCRSEAST